MSQSASVASSNFQLAEDLVVIKSSVVETNARQLMDELFAELEQDINHGELKELARPVQAALQPLAEPEIASEWVPLAHSSLSNQDSPTSSAERVEPLPRFRHIFKNQAVLAVAATSALATLFIGLGIWIQSSRVLAPTVATSQSANPLQPDTAELEFATYLQRSLEVIERTALPQPAIATLGTQQAGTLPSAHLPPPHSPPGVATVTERVYIPVYQPQPPQVVKKDVVTKKDVITKKVPQLAKAPPPLPKVATITTAPVVVTPTQTLIGVLELGDRSTALINTNGVPRRVQVGEELGSGGWFLLKVADQKAIIQRKGELRSIYVGQKF